MDVPCELLSSARVACGRGSYRYRERGRLPRHLPGQRARARVDLDPGRQPGRAEGDGPATVESVELSADLAPYLVALVTRRCQLERGAAQPARIGSGRDSVWRRQGGVLLVGRGAVPGRGQRWRAGEARDPQLVGSKCRAIAGAFVPPVLRGVDSWRLASAAAGLRSEGPDPRD